MKEELVYVDKIKVIKEHALEMIYYGLFSNCNAKCNMCDCWKVKRSYLSFDYYERILLSILSLNPKAIRFSGGEPLLFRELSHLISIANSKNVQVSVITNGLLLQKKIGNLIESGCKEIILSLDGYGEVHNKIRNTKGLFENCLIGIQAMKLYDLPYGVNTVVQLHNIDLLNELSNELLSSNYPPRWWHFIPVRDDESLLPSSDQIKRFNEFISSLTYKANKQGIVIIADSAMFSKMESTFCEVPNYTIYVRADTGNIYSCNMSAYGIEPIGNIIEESANKIWNGLKAEDMRLKCLDGTNSICTRCDMSSQKMNLFLRKQINKKEIIPIGE